MAQKATRLNSTRTVATCFWTRVTDQENYDEKSIKIKKLFIYLNNEQVSKFFREPCFEPRCKLGRFIKSARQVET